mmetsp:Transcript_25162/g.59841  ORF Transcript_25162/g.59841 Transcript_25162/m.59841 type:complete len:261 (+) Transcript_25162:445-1227(+)
MSERVRLPRPVPRPRGPDTGAGQHDEPREERRGAPLSGVRRFVQRTGDAAAGLQGDGRGAEGYVVGGTGQVGPVVVVGRRLVRGGGRPAVVRGEQAPSRPAPHVGRRAGRFLLRPQRPPGREVESGGDRLPRRADTALRRGQPPPEQRTEAHRLPKPDAQVEALPAHEEDEARPPQHTALPHGHRVHTRPEQGGLPLGARGLLRQLHRRRRRADRDTVPHGTGVAGPHRRAPDLHEDRVRRVRVAQERRRHGEEDRARDE